MADLITEMQDIMCRSCTEYEVNWCDGEDKQECCWMEKITEVGQTIEKEIRAKAIDEFAERLKSDEFQKYDLDMVFETSRDLSYSNCVNAFCEYVDKIAEEMRGGENEVN